MRYIQLFLYSLIVINSCVFAHEEPQSQRDADRQKEEARQENFIDQQKRHVKNAVAFLSKKMQAAYDETAADFSEAYTQVTEAAYKRMVPIKDYVAQKVTLVHKWAEDKYNQLKNRHG